MKPSEGVARISILIVGVISTYYVAATPGDQILVAVIAGTCIGLSISFILAAIE